VPETREIFRRLAIDTVATRYTASGDGVAVLIAAPAVEVKSVRINVTIPANVLDQIDRYAEREGFTRSGFLARAAKKAMAS
jgi:hypothetical protein